jgi:hypothetical protein
MQFGDIATDIAEAEGWLEGSIPNNNEQGVLCALRSIAASQIAIAKMMLRTEER